MRIGGITLTAGYGTRHPERQHGEVFICYTNPQEIADNDLPGKRFGTRVFDDDGDEVTDDENVVRYGVVPVFADKIAHGARYTTPPGPDPDDI